MAGERILVVEDEGIVAADLESILKKLGYQVTGTVPSGEEAVQKAEETIPDLVLMDIRLKGAMDGIDAAEQITARLNIPVTYLTAYADEATLERAKATMPYGYILKPFQENDIRAAVEVALYKHKMDAMVSSIQDWHASALKSVPDAVISADKNGHVSFLNETAETLLGWKLQEVYHKPLNDILPLPMPVEKMLQQAAPFHDATPVTIATKEGRKLDIQYSVALIKDMDGKTPGIIVSFHPVLREKKPAGSRN